MATTGRSIQVVQVNVNMASTGSGEHSCYRITRLITARDARLSGLTVYQLCIQSRLGRTHRALRWKGGMMESVRRRDHKRIARGEGERSGSKRARCDQGAFVRTGELEGNC